MRLSELLKADVVDVNGENIGRVHDARLVRDGPVQGSFGPGYRLQGLVVGAGSIGARLGFDRGTVHAPAPLKLLFRWIHKDSKFVEWVHVRSVEKGVVRLGARAEDLPAVPPLRQ